ncbi:SAM-dependent methyltransferase [Actinomadura sp. KC06]|uniref:SAM-dependent methyltransferase n=1 Tax=Actinomadura sp. KC06 TaxID=2530369 RepID=UPI001FB83413|nr:SAM-dependent methyltransferase [Actinomadura sp. KC06]
MSTDDPSYSAKFSVDVPTPARMYNYGLGGKDNYAVDRAAVRAINARFPEALDATRANRLFLYRVVRFLARDAGISQFLDLGSGLPTQHNVHQVAQQFRPDAHVVYVDNDPIVLTHGRAVLAENEYTTVIAQDMTKPDEVLDHPEVRRIIDFTQPVAALFLSVPHSIPDDEMARHTIGTITDALVSGSYVALSQFVGADQQTADEFTAIMHSVGMKWRSRTPDQVKAFVSGLEPVEPGMVNVMDWRPDPTQPPLDPVDPALQSDIGASTERELAREFGGVLRKP